MILAIRAVGAPLAAGCTVVFKASELCPAVHHSLVKAFTNAGLPPGCLNQLQARREDASSITESLIAHPAIRKIEFIGSATVGRMIGQLAAKYLKPVLMELGGKAPAIILRDADLKSAAELCVHGAILNHGQICVSTERIIVLREVAEEFTRYLKDSVKAHINDAGFAVTKGMAEKAHTIVSSAVEQGAEFVAGSNKFRGSSGVSLEPTIMTGVNPGTDMHEKETFGPSATLYIAEDEEEAIQIANDTPYGLNAAVHGRDVLAALKVAQRIDCGQVSINSVTMYDEPCAPIGGVKDSGWGRNNGKYAVREFLTEKTISIHDLNSEVAFGKK